MVNQQFGIDSEKLIQKSLIVNGTACYITHGTDIIRHKSFQYAAPHPPKISQRLMFPKLATIARLIKLGYPHPILVRTHLFRHNIHRNLAEIQICPDTRCRSDTSLTQNIQYDLSGELMGRKLV